MNKRTKIFFAAAVIFISGFLSGAVLSHLAPPMLHGFFRPPNPAHFKEKLSEKIAKELKLSPEQKADLQKKLETKMESFAAEHRMIRKAFGEMLDSTIQGIEPALSEEQKKSFAFHKKEREERDSKNGGMPPPDMRFGPGGPPPRH